MTYELGEELGLNSLLQHYPLLKEVVDLTVNHTVWRKRHCLNMIASENVMSPLAMLAYMNDMMHRYAGGEALQEVLPGSSIRGRTRS